MVPLYRSMYLDYVECLEKDYRPDCNIGWYYASVLEARRERDTFDSTPL